ncbi:MAG: N-carbamoyl-L-amino acid amidohydrolase [Mariprofundaceae bacterium]|nr:N-carbamoyl-L-amino acid amidohydrolase [Mariprofundaceae bacterium]
MFVKIDKKTREETVISSTDMTLVLERDFNDKMVDSILTDMAMGEYEHRDREASYKYKA